MLKLRFLTVFLSIISLFFSLSAWSAADVKMESLDNKQFLQKIVESVFDVLRSTSSKQEKLGKIEQIVFQSYDVGSSVKQILGPYWAKMSPEQRKSFFNTYKEYLMYNYSTKLFLISPDIKYKIVDSRYPISGDQTAVSLICNVKNASNEDVRIVIDYIIVKKDNKFFVNNMIVDGLDLLASQTDEFRAIFNSHANIEDGLKAAIDKMKSITNTASKK
jgi:ABC-type transporter MlaC component